jgi:hypothetical protein
MCRGFELDCSGGRDIAAQRALGFLEDPVNLLLWQDDSHHR